MTVTFPDLNANDDLLRTCTDKNHTGNIQSFLICATSAPLHEKCGTFYIKADGMLIDVGSNAVTAMDILIKLHYCFYVQFAHDLEFFYNFITSQIMEMSDPKARTCCIVLNLSLQHVVLSSTSEKLTSEMDGADCEEDACSLHSED
ncbi:uncharacterized protein LOC117169933 [Belonocnema kinseyi]|uniref:uncharacterized protein LOC117169933 n=1 Tax=Belonocnema kinseyi TaxID=2817044 RepID=UPI00143DD3F5|nr:uncharacterized protein LOC117169933 [Belonocnema kinseyi]